MNCDTTQFCEKERVKKGTGRVRHTDESDKEGIYGGTNGVNGHKEHNLILAPHTESTGPIPFPSGRR